MTHETNSGSVLLDPSAASSSSSVQKKAPVSYPFPNTVSMFSVGNPGAGDCAFYTLIMGLVPYLLDELRSFCISQGVPLLQDIFLEQNAAILSEFLKSQPAAAHSLVQQFITVFSYGHDDPLQGEQDFKKFLKKITEEATSPQPLEHRFSCQSLDAAVKPFRRALVQTNTSEMERQLAYLQKRAKLGLFEFVPHDMRFAIADESFFLLSAEDQAAFFQKHNANRVLIKVLDKEKSTWKVFSKIEGSSAPISKPDRLLDVTGDAIIKIIEQEAQSVVLGAVSDACNLLLTSETHDLGRLSNDVKSSNTDTVITFKENKFKLLFYRDKDIIEVVINETSPLFQQLSAWWGNRAAEPQVPNALHKQLLIFCKQQPKIELSIELESQYFWDQLVCKALTNHEFKSTLINTLVCIINVEVLESHDLSCQGLLANLDAKMMRDAVLETLKNQGLPANLHQKAVVVLYCVISGKICTNYQACLEGLKTLAIGEDSVIKKAVNLPVTKSTWGTDTDMVNVAVTFNAEVHVRIQYPNNPDRSKLQLHAQNLHNVHWQALWSFDQRIKLPGEAARMTQELIIMLNQLERVIDKQYNGALGQLLTLLMPSSYQLDRGNALGERACIQRLIKFRNGFTVFADSMKDSLGSLTSNPLNKVCNFFANLLPVKLVVRPMLCRSTRFICDQMSQSIGLSTQFVRSTYQEKDTNKVELSRALSDHDLSLERKKQAVKHFAAAYENNPQEAMDYFKAGIGEKNPLDEQLLQIFLKELKTVNNFCACHCVYTLHQTKGTILKFTEEEVSCAFNEGLPGNDTVDKLYNLIKCAANIGGDGKGGKILLSYVAENPAIIGQIIAGMNIEECREKSIFIMQELIDHLRPLQGRFEKAAELYANVKIKYEKYIADKNIVKAETDPNSMLIAKLLIMCAASPSSTQQSSPPDPKEQHGQVHCSL